MFPKVKPPTGAGAAEVPEVGPAWGAVLLLEVNPAAEAGAGAPPKLPEAAGCPEPPNKPLPVLAAFGPELPLEALEPPALAAGT